MQSTNLFNIYKFDAYGASSRAESITLVSGTDYISANQQNQN